MGKRTSSLATAQDFDVREAEIISAENTSVVVADKKAIATHLKELDGAFSSVEKAFFKIAFNLHWFYETNAFCEVGGKGYDNITQFAKDRYGLSKATTYNYIKVVERFGSKNPDGSITSIREQYKDFSSTKLLLMSNADEEVLAKCTSDMRVKDIKALMSAADADVEEPTAIVPEPPVKAVSDKQELFKIDSYEDFEKRKTEIIKSLEKVLRQDSDGVRYGISISMIW